MRNRAMRAGYAAGFIDGEGSIGIYRHSTSGQYQLRMSASNTVEAPIKLLQKLFGGSYRINQERTSEKHRNPYRWYIMGTQAARALTEILPYLLVKQEQAKLGIRFQNKVIAVFVQSRRKNGQVKPMTAREKRKRDRYVEESRQLNKRGPQCSETS